MRALLLVLLLWLSGCSYWQSGDPRGPDGVNPEVRMALRIAMVGYTGTMLLLYGGAAHDVFLGCLSCDKDDAMSIFNDAARYGSLSDPHSIWNSGGDYGSTTSPVSPWNPHPSAPPIIRDEYEHSYGYFTIDASYPERTRLPAVIQFLKLQSLK